jgi:hypothetical protein
MTCDGQKSSSHGCHGPPFQRSDWVTSCALGIVQNYTICLGEHFVSLITKENPPSKYTRDFLRGWLLHEQEVAAKGMPRINSKIPIEYSYRSTWFFFALFTCECNSMQSTALFMHFGSFHTNYLLCRNVGIFKK